MRKGKVLEQEKISPELRAQVQQDKARDAARIASRDNHRHGQTMIRPSSWVKVAERDQGLTLCVGCSEPEAHCQCRPSGDVDSNGDIVEKTTYSVFGWKTRSEKEEGTAHVCPTPKVAALTVQSMLAGGFYQVIVQSSEPGPLDYP